jgi:hypothetical protein
MPKSGPRELLAYHQQQLNKERNKMSTATSFDTERLDEEALAEANARLAKINGPTKDPDPKPITETQPAPAAAPKNPAAAEPSGEKKQRMTVSKLADRYKDRVESLTAEIAKAESHIQVLQIGLQEMRSKLAVWQEALTEIGAD